jgi:hypothetical protein
MQGATQSRILGSQCCVILQHQLAKLLSVVSLLLLLLPGVLNTNMWGMAMAGADICGFADMTQVRLIK